MRRSWGADNLPKIGILFLLFILAYLSTLQWMWERWFEYGSYYSHGILVPLISIVLIWQQRGVLKNIKAVPSGKGLWLFALGIALHLISQLLQVYFTSGFSMILVISGFVLGVWGKDVLKKILFPIIFLVFMVPLPLEIVVNVSFELKLMSAAMATAVLNVLNIPAFQQGSYIRMDHASVVVEDVCSGLRSLISFMALGALFAYWMKSGTIKRLSIFFSSIPIALIANMFRIVILAIITEFLGAQYITGFVHQLFGLLVFAVAFLLLAQIERILK